MGNNDIIEESRKLRELEKSPNPNVYTSPLSPSLPISSSSYLSRPMLALNKKKISPNLFSGLNIHSDSSTEYQNEARHQELENLFFGLKDGSRDEITDQDMAD